MGYDALLNQDLTQYEDVESVDLLADHFPERSKGTKRYARTRAVCQRRWSGRKNQYHNAYKYGIKGLYHLESCYGPDWIDRGNSKKVKGRPKVHGKPYENDRRASFRIRREDRKACQTGLIQSLYPDMELDPNLKQRGVRSQKDQRAKDIRIREIELRRKEEKNSSQLLRNRLADDFSKPEEEPDEKFVFEAKGPQPPSPKRTSLLGSRSFEKRRVLKIINNRRKAPSGQKPKLRIVR